jgi:hypothetical protein
MSRVQLALNVNGAWSRRPETAREADDDDPEPDRRRDLRGGVTSHPNRP